MKGKHKIEVRSGRVVFTIELERNITILRGDSATGKNNAGGDAASIRNLRQTERRNSEL